MKNIFVLICILTTLKCSAQTINEYKALNNIIYKTGDTVKLGRGSAPDGSFNYLQMSGFGAMLAHKQQRGSQLNIDRSYANTAAVIKKMKISKINGVQKMSFTVSSDGPMNFNLAIDEAIQACEVLPCLANNQASTQMVQPLSVADEILKLKKLLDAGAITQTEYDAQKKKLLGP